MRNEYNRILSNLAQARKENHSRRIKLALRKLHNWQVRYGAHQPVNMEVSTCRSRTDDLSQ